MWLKTEELKVTASGKHKRSNEEEYDVLVLFDFWNHANLKLKKLESMFNDCLWQAEQVFLN